MGTGEAEERGRRGDHLVQYFKLGLDVFLLLWGCIQSEHLDSHDDLGGLVERPAGDGHSQSAEVKHTPTQHKVATDAVMMSNGCSW